MTCCCFPVLLLSDVHACCRMVTNTTLAYGFIWNTTALLPRMTCAANREAINESLESQRYATTYHVPPFYDRNDAPV